MQNSNTNIIVRKHTISLLVADKPGVLIRISLVFARRGFNIDSLVVSASKDPGFSIMNISAKGDAKTLVQIIKQLNKLVDVVSASDRTDDDILSQELALFKVRHSAENRAEILQLAGVIGCKTLDIAETAIVFQLSGSSDTIDGAITVFDPYGIIELMRTGKVLMTRGVKRTS